VCTPSIQRRTVRTATPTKALELPVALPAGLECLCFTWFATELGSRFAACGAATKSKPVAKGTWRGLCQEQEAGSPLLQVIYIAI
jgi:hypothetical protein